MNLLISGGSLASTLFSLAHSVHNTKRFFLNFFSRKEGIQLLFLRWQPRFKLTCWLQKSTAHRIRSWCSSACYSSNRGLRDEWISTNGCVSGRDKWQDWNGWGLLNRGVHQYKEVKEKQKLGTTESLRLEKTTKITKLNQLVPITSPKLSSSASFLRVSWSSPRAVTPPPPLAVYANAQSVFQKLFLITSTGFGEFPPLLRSMGPISLEKGLLVPLQPRAHEKSTRAIPENPVLCLLLTFLPYNSECKKQVRKIRLFRSRMFSTVFCKDFFEGSGWRRHLHGMHNYSESCWFEASIFTSCQLLPAQIISFCWQLS